MPYKPIGEGSGGGGGGSGKGGGGYTPVGGGGSGSSSRSRAKKKINKVLLNAIALGDKKTVKQIATATGMTDRDRKALLKFTEQATPSGFIDRLGLDMSNTVQGLARGLPQMGKDFAADFTAPVRLGVNAAQGEDISGDEILGSIPVVGQSYALGKSAITGKPLPNNPFASGVGLSFRRTGERVSDPKKAAEDYSQRPFSTLMEDVGNVALVAAPAAKLARVAGLSKSATALERVNAAGNQIASLPFKPVSMPARALNAMLVGGELPLTGRILKGLSASERLNPIMTAFRATPEMRTTRQIIREGNETVAMWKDDLASAFRDQQKVLPKIPEQEAAYLIGQGQATALAQAKGALAPDDFTRLVDENLGDDFSPEAVDLAIDVVEGRNPELASRIDEMMEMGRAGRVARGERDLSPESLAAQQGMQPLQSVIAEKTAPLRKKVEGAAKFAEKMQDKADANRGRAARAAENAEFIDVPAVQRPRSGEFGPSSHIPEDVGLARTLGRAETTQKFLDNQAVRAARRLDRLQQKLMDTETNVAQSIEAAPARLRPLLETNRAVVQELTRQENHLRAANLPGSADMIGVIADEIPTTLKALEEAGIDVEHFINPREKLVAGPGVPSTTLRLPKTGRRDATRRRTGKGAHDMTIRGQARAEARRAEQVIAKQTEQRLAAQPFVTRGTDHMIADGTTLRFKTRAELNAEGLEAWAPGSAFETQNQIGPDTLIVPKPVHEAFKSYFAPDGILEKTLQKTYDPVTRTFKTIVLPLSPAWNVGNAVTNAFMAVLAGGVDPFTLTKQIGASIAHHGRIGEWAGPQRLYQSGSTHETLDFLGDQNRLSESKAMRVGRTPARVGYKVNQTVDNVFRSAVYLSKKAKGYSDEGAMRIALDALGDFTKMSKFERQTVRRIIPFYAWLRHMTKVAVKMPIEHPFRTAWILSMGQAFSDSEAWEELLPSYLQGGIPLGGDSILNAANFMPFSHPFSIANLGQNLNPILKFAMVNAPGSPAKGINPLTGLPYSRPPGTGPFTETGKPAPAAPSIFEQLRSIPPQMRTIDALTGRKDVARYESGDVVMIRGEDGKRHPIKVPQSAVRTLSKYVGFPIQSRKQLQEIVQAIIERRMENWKTANPVKDLSRSSGGSSGGGGYTPIGR